MKLIISYLKWKLVGKEGAHQIAGVTSQPQQQKPNREGAVHIPCSTGAIVLSEKRQDRTRHEKTEFYMMFR